MNLIRYIKQYPVAVFIICTFILSVAATFAPVGDENKFLILGALLVPIPAIVSIALAHFTGGIRPFLHDTFDWHMDLKWVLLAFGIALGARLAMSLLALLTGAIPSIVMSAANPAIVIVIYLFALLEEMGWRGFAVRRLILDHSPIAVLLVTGIPWSIIHIFFYLSQGADLATLAQVFVLNFALTTMVTWVYLRGGRKLWVGVILHGSQSLFAIFNTNIAPDLSVTYSVLIYSLIALVVLIIDWRMWFAQSAKITTNEVVLSVGQ